jgi:hypothetical protein
MQQFCTYGSVRGASGNRRPYRDMTTGRNPFASCAKAPVMTTAVGRPRFSRLTASCKLHDVQDPQSPIAVSAMSL